MKKQFIALHPNTKEIKILKEREDKVLTELNQNGYNIYESVNYFIGEGRKIKDLLKFASIGIDWDIGADKKFKDIESILSHIQNKVGILPSKINETFKGYHLWFDLEESLSHITKESYISLYQFINTHIEGDTKMKDITSILKIEGFSDMKEDRNFRVVNIYSNTDNKIMEDYFETYRILLSKYNKEEYNNSIKKRIRNQLDVQNIDALELVYKINELNSKNHPLFKTKIGLIQNSDTLYSIEGTDGLKIQKNEELNLFEFCDYSTHKRSGIGNFIYNFYGKNSKKEESNRIYGILMAKFDVKLQSKGTKFSIGKEIIIKTINDDYEKAVIVNDDGFEEVNELIDKINQRALKKDSVMKTMLALFYYAKMNGLNVNEASFIGEKELLLVLKLSDNFVNRKYLKEAFLELNSITFTKNIEELNNGKKYTVKVPIKVFDAKFAKLPEQNNKMFYRFKMNIHNNSLFYFPEELLWLGSGLLNSQKTYVGCKISSTIQSFGTCNYSLEKFVEDFQYKTKDKKEIKKYIKKYLESLLAINCIKGFEKSKTDMYRIW